MKCQDSLGLPECMATQIAVSTASNAVMQALSPLGRTPQPESTRGGQHAQRDLTAALGAQDAMSGALEDQVPEQIVDEEEDDRDAALAGWLSAAAGSTATWQLPPRVEATHRRSPQLSARSSLLSPGPLRFSYREAAAASAARRSAARKARSSPAQGTSSSWTASPYPPLEVSELSPERRPHVRVPTLEARSLQAAQAESSLHHADGASPVSLRKRFGGFRAYDSLPTPSWHGGQVETLG